MNFEWDDGNKLKSVTKHEITNLEAESMFADPGKVVRLSKHGSGTEIRYLCYAVSNQGKFVNHLLLN